MLRIGDVHITRKYAPTILYALREEIAESGETHIVFMGDYVYHFSYDRKVLLDLFSLFLELVQSGKHVYVLAGNHDWIDNHFVYQEAASVLKALQSLQGQTNLHLIQEPQLLSIEGQDCLFFPYHYPLEQEFRTDQFAELLSSGHIQEQQSGRVNSLLTDLIDAWVGSEKKSDKLCVFHHWYIASTRFPGQKAQFSYKSPALSPHFLERDDLLLVSGHLHQAFGYKNYFCTGSVRATSPLERNQPKFIFQRQGGPITPRVLQIKQYLQIGEEASEYIETMALQTFRDTLLLQQRELMCSGVREVANLSPVDIDLSHTTLVVQSQSLAYTELPDKIAVQTYAGLEDVKIKRQRMDIQEVSSLMETSSLQLDQSIQDWKILLHEYLQQKFPDSAEKYQDILKEMKIL